MDEQTRSDWNRAVAADLRIAELADAACYLLRSAEPGTGFAVNLYSDVREYLECLVGFTRKQPFPAVGRTRTEGAHERFLAILRQPIQISVENVRFLSSARAYDVTHDVVLTRLREIEERAEWRG
ncbi:hypothetical protein B0I29_12191 [Actinoplanes lutulentus]|uniref:Uncharacterized protein n=2 Tax=Actinoplanes lutulentus TaxID=1287878 RepID=A0A327Z411_9ACTN|nr:hypothetical protein B0I29_12191 [Actinoplanes lutulentus]